MSVLDKVELELGGKAYTLALTTKQIMRLEPEVSTKNIVKLMANAPWSMADTMAVFKRALLGGNPELKESDITDLFESALAQYGYISLMEMLFTKVLGGSAPLKRDIENYQKTQAPN